MITAITAAIVAYCVVAETPELVTVVIVDVLAVSALASERGSN